MCGLVGYLGGSEFGARAASRLAAMTSAIAHRGPDGSGWWADDGARVALGHRRLAIVDLSSAGAQPMSSASGQRVLVFNGEIYNHGALRAAMAAEEHAPAWRGHSDTETLLAAFDAWGVEEGTRRTVGMFAFALWDRGERTLTLGRDRLGEKPLYYGWQSNGGETAFLFGSEIKALRPHPAFAGEIDRRALQLFMRHSYIPDPHAIVAGLRKLSPGTLARVSLAAPEPVLVRYWDSVEAAERGARDPVPDLDPQRVIDALEAVLMEAVGQQMVADVPLGAFLSGGIDSSVVTALMQAQSARPVKTFTIGFHEKGFNEADHARRVAAHLGAEHTELYVGSRELLEVVPLLPQVYDEPFADASQIPTCLVAGLARRNVTVALSGDGGDELFAGYDRYQQVAAFWARVGPAPMALRCAGAAALEAIPAPALALLARPFMGTHPADEASAAVGQRLHRIAAYARGRSTDEIHRSVVSHWRDKDAVVIGAGSPEALAPPAPRMLGAVERMMLSDMLTYLPEDVMTKVDRAAMRVSLETRAPLLDHRVVEFAARMPLSLKLRDGRSKWALRQVLYRHVPAAIVDRPKMGFSVPVAAWLRGPLRNWAEALLDERRLSEEGYLTAAPIRRKWAEHLSGRMNWRFHLWNALMFQAWLEDFRAPVATGAAAEPAVT